MILYLTTRESSNTFRYLERDWARDLKRQVVRTTYEEIIERGTVPRATLLFTDHERMSPELLGLACQLWDQATPHCRALNNPHRLLTRAPLLEALSAEGVNRHRAFAPHAVPSDLRYPVFLRGIQDHLGPLTDLLPDRAALEAALLRLQIQGRRNATLLVVEYEDSRGSDGTFRKFAAFRVGDAIIPRHLIVGQDWMLKINHPSWRTNAAEEQAYARDNPHEAELRRAFETAGIEYGRIDYGLSDGRVRVWEINTNPTVMSDFFRTARARRPLQREFLARFRAALDGLDDVEPGEAIPLTFRPAGLAPSCTMDDE